MVIALFHWQTILCITSYRRLLSVLTEATFFCRFKYIAICGCCGKHNKAMVPSVSQFVIDVVTCLICYQHYFAQTLKKFSLDGRGTWNKPENRVETNRKQPCLSTLQCSMAPWINHLFMGHGTGQQGEKITSGRWNWHFSINCLANEVWFLSFDGQNEILTLPPWNHPFGYSWRNTISVPGKQLSDAHAPTVFTYLIFDAYTVTFVE